MATLVNLIKDISIHQVKINKEKMQSDNVYQGRWVASLCACGKVQR